MKISEEVLKPLSTSDWEVRFLSKKNQFPSDIISRYPWIDNNLIDLICNLDIAEKKNQKKWLLSINDYSNKSNSPYTWNEWESQSIKAAEDDQEWIKEIKNFWNENFPIAYSVENGYSYLSLRRNGQIFFGEEPEYEDATLFAQSYKEAIHKISNGEF